MNKYFMLYIAILHNHGINSKKAWQLPAKLQARVGEQLTPALISELKLNQLQKLYLEPTSLHRFYNKLSNYLYCSCLDICQYYDGNIDLMLLGDQSQIIDNLQKLPGMSKKKARHMYFYLNQFDSKFAISEETIDMIRIECPQLLENYKRNINLLVEQSK